VQERRCASQQKLRADVADGSDSAAGQCPWHVRYPPESCRESGHLRSAGSCQNRTNCIAAK
jgi:hypothetical protein